MLCEPAHFGALSDALAAAKIKTESAEITMIPDTYTPVTDKGVASTMMKFVEALEDLDDVQNVYTNADIPDDMLESLG